MTTPANPAGQYRETMARALKEWLDAQQIEGLSEVLPGEEEFLPWDDHMVNGAVAACIVVIAMPRTSEDRAAGTGPTNRGGKDLHYSIELEVTHRSFDTADGWSASRVDYNRIVDALKDCLRGVGRDLGRPEVVFQLGEFPRTAGIVDEHEEAFKTDDGAVERGGVISFTLTQYLPTNVP